jgi:cytidine deaminase
MHIFGDRPVFEADELAQFPTHDRSVAEPLVGLVREDEDRAERERQVVNRLREEYRA